MAVSTALQSSVQISAIWKFAVSARPACSDRPRLQEAPPQLRVSTLRAATSKDSRPPSHRHLYAPLWKKCRRPVSNCWSIRFSTLKQVLPTVVLPHKRPHLLIDGEYAAAHCVSKTLTREINSSSSPLPHSRISEPAQNLYLTATTGAKGVAPETTLHKIFSGPRARQALFRTRI